MKLRSRCHQEAEKIWIWQVGRVANTASVLPTSSARNLVRCLESCYVVEDTKGTIGLKGVSGFGKGIQNGDASS